MLILAPSCKKGANEETLNQLKGSLDSLFDARLAAWDTMITEDDKKIRYMTRLLDEISYQVSYDEIKMNNIRSRVSQLPALRFRMDEIGIPDKVQQYDDATDSTIRVLVDFVAETEQAADIPLVADLMTDIRYMDNFVLQRRNQYDDATMALNQLIEENKKQIKQLGGPYLEIETFPLFVLFPG